MDWKRIFTYSIALTCFFAAGCSTLPHEPGESTSKPLAFTSEQRDNLVARFSPIVSAELSTVSYNKIGSVKADYLDEKEHIFVDSEHPTFYTDQRTFISALGNQYTNLIYRIHFEEVPFSIIPFHLTAGNNGGLIFVITLNNDGEPVLITSVHSCGCYLGFTPTSLLPKDAYPEGWDFDENSVFGENLPPMLTLPSPYTENDKILIQLRDATHRVMDIQHITLQHANAHYSVIEAADQPMSSLKKLRLPDQTTTSFYHTEGLRKGYVKDATKPFELLLMSWWTFDLFVGRDKEFGPREETGSVFYTSLQPWNRKASDMWEFEKFLTFWGWRL